MGVDVTATGFAEGAPDEDDAKSEEQFAAIYELTGYVEFWFGTRPKSIAGKLNPTLTFEAGKQYKVRWTNGDGMVHSFVISNGNREWVLATEIGDGVGTTKEITFTATEEMSEYMCSIHPKAMRGDVTVNGSTDAGTGVEVPADISPVDAKAAVKIPDQPADGEFLISKATVPEGGFAMLHTPKFKARPRTIRKIKLSAICATDYLQPGTHRDIRLETDQDFSEYDKIIAMVHRDTNDNQEFDFVTDGPHFAEEDAPYLTPKGKVVMDTAKLTKQ